MTKILHLTLRKKWFKLIASGEKKVEYRTGKDYWRKRFLDNNGFAIEFDEVHFRNGYGKNVPFVRVEWKDLGQLYGNDPWPFPGEHGEEIYKGDFAIHLGNVLEVRE